MVVARLWLPGVSSEEKGVVVVVVEEGRGIRVLSATGLELVGWERVDG